MTPSFPNSEHLLVWQLRRCRRPGYTLLELVLVLAIIVLMIGLTWPLLEQPLAYERLRHAADQVLAEWTTARIEAMRTGEHRIFCYEQDSPNYWFEGDSTPEEQRPKLPEGVIFVSSQKEEDARESLEEGGLGDLGDPEIWFYADGTCSDVPELLLANEYGMRIRLVLRGLTGVTLVDENVMDAEEQPGPRGRQP